MDLLVVGDSHIDLIVRFLKKDKYLVHKLKFQDWKIHFVGVIGGSMRGMTKQKSTTNIRKKVEKILDKYPIKTIMICLGFNDVNAIFPHKIQENHSLTFQKYTNELVKLFYECFLKDKKEKYKIVVQSVIPNPLMDVKRKYYRYLRTYKISDGLSDKEKTKIFNDYWSNLRYFNRKLKEMCVKHGLFFVDNQKIYDLLYKNRKFTTSQKIDAPMHYKPIYNLLYLIDGMDKYYQKGVLKKDKMIILNEIAKYSIKASKSPHTIAFCRDLLNYYEK